MSNYGQPPAAPPPLPVPGMPVQMQYATPQGYQYEPQFGPWREGMLLVTTNNAVLPDFCVKCNAPAEGQKVKRLMAWHEPWLYALIVAGVVVYAIVAMVMQKKATVHFGLCAVHRAKRTRMILIAWGIAAVGLLVGIGGSIGARVLKPAKIDDRFAWFKGAHPDYLSRFPSTR